MLPKRERFTREQLNTFLLQKGVSNVYNQLGTYKFIQGDPKRLTVVTSGKHEKRARTRNLLRRRLYSLFRTSNTPLQGIFYASKQSYRFDYETTKKSFHELLSKASK